MCRPGIIYCLKNKINGKVYIGQTTRTLKKRCDQHRHRKNTSTAIGLAIKKYGWGAFEVSILETCNSIEELNKAEQEWIKYFKATDKQYGYNLLSGGLNRDVSKETRIKMSKAHKGKIITEEHRLNLSKATKGKKKSEQARKNIGDAIRKRVSSSNYVAPNTGKKHSPETIQKMKEARKNYKISEKTKEKIRQTAKQKIKDNPELAKMLTLRLKTAKYTEERKIELSKRNTGKGNPFYGKKHSAETLEKMRKNGKGKLLGVKKSEEHCKKIKEGLLRFYAKRKKEKTDE